MAVATEIDVRALRRIALLVMRATQDCGSGCPELHDIAAVIDRLKRNIVLGSTFAPGDIRRMRLFVKQLDSDRAQYGLQYGIVDELRELVRLLQ